MGARFYDPALARWLSADTLVPEPANPQSLNRYSYVLGNPCGYSDPSGHTPCGRACPGDWTNWQIDFGAAYGGKWDPVEQARNRAIVQRAFSLAVDFSPGVGDAKGFAEALTGADLLTGESLGNWRWLGLVGLSELRPLRYADEVLEIGAATGRVLQGGQWIELGRWSSRSVRMSDAASAYQQFVTGAEAGYEFFRNGVWFDGIRMTGEGEAVLLDAKSGADFYRKAGGLPFVQETALEDANRQLAAAAGLRIQWHIQDRTTWEALRELFGRFQIGIELVWTPGP